MDGRNQFGPNGRHEQEEKPLKDTERTERKKRNYSAAAAGFNRKKLQIVPIWSFSLVGLLRNHRSLLRFKADLGAFGAIRPRFRSFLSCSLLY
jgi:hypothetical protein